MLASETATAITLRGQEGKQETLLRTDLDELVSTRKSLMPEGLEKDLNRQQLADVIAYLTAMAGRKLAPAGGDAPSTPATTPAK